MKPKILLVHDHYQIPGGEDAVFRNEQKLLRDNGHTVLCYTRSNEELKGLSAAGRALAGLSSLFSFRTLREVKELIRREKPDLMWVHNTLTQVSPSVYYAAFAAGIPVIQTVHNFRLFCPGALCYREGRTCTECVEHGLLTGVSHRCYRNSGAQTLVLTLQLFLHRLLGTYRKLHYVCLTPFSAELFRKGMGKHIDPGRVFVKGNFVTKEPEAPQENAAAFAADIRAPYYLCLGRLEPSKGIPWLLEEWKRVPGAGLLVAGEGSLEEMVRSAEKESSGRIRYLGPLSHRNALQYLKHAEALIFPSEWYENFPMVIAEAMSLGTPVICRDIGNGAAIVKKAAPELVLGGTFHGARAEDRKDNKLPREGMEPEESMPPGESSGLAELLRHYRKEDCSAAFFRAYEETCSPEANYRIMEEIMEKVLREQNAKRRTIRNVPGTDSSERE